MRFVIISLIVLLVVGPLGVYVHRRASRLLGLGLRGRRALSFLLAAGLLTMTLGRLGRGALPDGVLRAMGLGGSTISLAILISAVLLA
ncbi:MAG TPA: hypothetical protein VL242_04875, partial [Sorangium sp.]|nr:hypothetical protein [Sorangium sp.]